MSSTPAMENNGDSATVAPHSPSIVDAVHVLYSCNINSDYPPLLMASTTTAPPSSTRCRSSHPPPVTASHRCHHRWQLAHSSDQGRSHLSTATAPAPPSSSIAPSFAGGLEQRSTWDWSSDTWEIQTASDSKLVL